MAVQTSYPGVYIEEFAPGAPIQGVGTSTAAFIGVATQGDLEVPTELTAWDDFKSTFGDQPIPGFYLWFAVQGFFQNGGKTCYIVRASNGAYATALLTDASGTNNLIRVRSRRPGNPATAITVDLVAAHLIQSATTSVYQPTATLLSAPVGRDLTLSTAATAAQFRPGDVITVGTTGATATVVRVSGTGVRIDQVLSGGPYAAGAPVRLADAPAGARTIRVASTVAIAPGTLVPGTMLTIDDGVNPDTQIVESVQTEHVSATVVTYRVTFRAGLTLPLSLDPANPATVESEEFSMTVAQGVSTTYQNLSIDSAHPRYVIRMVNGDATGLVNLSMVDPPPPLAPPNNLPALGGGATALASGVDEDLTTIGSTDFLRALDTLAVIDDVNLVACPDCLVATAAIDPATVQQGLIAHCELLADRFAVLDSIPGRTPFGATSIESQRVTVDSTRGYAALYYPWLRVPPIGPGDPILVPPSGHVCGIIARSDNTRGVHKAPANELVNGALGVERRLSDIEQGQLNLQGVNVLRVFATGGRVNLWGARTTATDLNWMYVNIRRLFLYLEESIEEGIRSSVFEPNNLQLWGKLKRTISDFLLRSWRDGALFGATQEEAFYVRIDEILNPFSEQALGRLHIEIGVRPSYPAEFIIVRIGIWDGGQQVSEG